jgi:hypothetical protein
MVQIATSPITSRRRRKSRPLLRRSSIFRTVFFIIVDLVGYVFVNAFLYYLSTGRWLDFSLHSYRSALASPLSEVLLHPLSIFEYPWMILVTGLLIAAVVFVPIMVAVLYRLSISALFILTVAVIAHAPLLAVFLAAGCILAGRTGLRRDLPLVALLAGLAPVAVYFYFFTGGDEALLPPLQGLSVSLILILTLIAAVLAGAVVSFLARLMRFRPGIIWPVILVLLSVPAWVFSEKIGVDELDYAFLTARVGPGEAIFVPSAVEDISYPVRITSLPASTRPASRPASQPASRPASQPAVVASKAALAMLVRARVDLEQQRTALTAGCQRFLKRHPDSARSAAVMWIMATAKDIRIDKQAIMAGTIRYRYTGPSAESQGAWSDLTTERYRRCPQAFIAHQRLGIQALREGQSLQRAREHLRIAQTLLTTHLGQQDPDPPAGPVGVFIQRNSLPSKEYYRKVLAETDNIIWLMEINEVRDDNSKNTDAFRDYMKLWPFVGTKSSDLRELAKGYKDTNLSDNFLLRAALAEKNEHDRAKQLSQLAGEINDAAIVANYELGRLALRLEGTPMWSKMNLKPAEHYFRIVKSAQDNPYRISAEQHLAWIEGRKQTTTMPKRSTEKP